MLSIISATIFLTPTLQSGDVFVSREHPTTSLISLTVNISGSYVKRNTNPYGSKGETIVILNSSLNTSGTSRNSYPPLRGRPHEGTVQGKAQTESSNQEGARIVSRPREGAQTGERNQGKASIG